jgi:large subunit ribosomal protein L22
MEAIAKTKNLKGSPRKARLVIDLIRGRNVSQALAILKFTDKRAAEPIEKTLRSAIANATYLAEKQNIAIDPDDLFVKSCFVDMGPHKNRRRMRPAPQGRAYREQRHYCHITVLVSSEAPAEKDIKESKKGKEGDKSSNEKKAKTSSTKTTATPAPKESVKETKKAKKEETVVEEIANVAVEAPIEKAKSPKAAKSDKKTVEKEKVKSEAEAADAKDVASQTPAEKNETQPADEKQQDTNEELERQ